MTSRSYYVYILASLSHSLYIGVTNDLHRRVSEHKEGLFPCAHTSRYRIDRLVHFEHFEDISNAIAREKQLKGLLRKRKVELVEQNNPQWLDLTSTLGIS